MQVRPGDHEAYHLHESRIGLRGDEGAEVQPPESGKDGRLWEEVLGLPYFHCSALGRNGARQAEGIQGSGGSTPMTCPRPLPQRSTRRSRVRTG